MFSSSTAKTSEYDKIKSTYLKASKDKIKLLHHFNNFKPKTIRYHNIEGDNPLHQLYFSKSELLNAETIKPTSENEKADLEIKKAIVKAIQSNDTKTLQRLLKRSTMETKKEGHDEKADLFDRELVHWIPFLAANVYSLIYLANQPDCTQQTRETIYQCLDNEENYLPYFKSFFTTASGYIFNSYHEVGVNYHIYHYLTFHKLHLAAALNMKEKFQQLLQQYGSNHSDHMGIETNSGGCFSTTPLGWAATFGQLEMVKFLQSIGARLDVNSLTCPPYMSSPSPPSIICVTLSEKHDAVTRYLLDNINVQDPIGFLNMVVQFNNLPILRYAYEKFKIPFLTLIEQNAYPIIFALIEAGLELPADAPEDLLKAAKLWKTEKIFESSETAAAAAAAASITTAKPDLDSVSTLSAVNARP